MDKVVNILMQRDGYSEEEAIELIEETREEIMESQDDMIRWEEILWSNLNLEPDFIFEFL